MEAEVRAILGERLASPTPSFGLGSHIHARFAGLGGAELDTNVISELARIDAEPVVVTWLDPLPAAEAATAIAAAELLYGVARLPDGRRRAALAETIDVLINEDFRVTWNLSTAWPPSSTLISSSAGRKRGGPLARRMLDRRHLPRVQRHAGHP